MSWSEPSINAVSRLTGGRHGVDGKMIEMIDSHELLASFVPFVN